MSLIKNTPSTLVFPLKKLDPHAIEGSSGIETRIGTTTMSSAQLRLSNSNAVATLELASDATTVLKRSRRMEVGNGKEYRSCW